MRPVLTVVQNMTDSSCDWYALPMSQVGRSEKDAQVGQPGEAVVNGVAD